MSAFLNSGRADHAETTKTTGRFRPEADAANAGKSIDALLITTNRVRPALGTGKVIVPKMQRQPLPVGSSDAP